MNLRRNGIFSGVEVIVSGLGLFLIYRNVAEVLGVSMLGVWGLVLSATAFGRAADLGIAGGLSRFVARSLAEGSRPVAIAYIRTGVVFASVAMGGVVLALWWPLWLGLDLALTGPDLAAAREVLPWAILSVWLLMVKSTLDSALIGVGRADLRSVAGIAGMIFQVVVSLVLISPFGLNGLAWAQAGQFALAIVLEIVFLVVTTAGIQGAKAGRTWFSTSLFKEMFGFGLALQAGTLGTLLFDPVVKTVIGATAGTYVLGVFEIAYRSTYQVKNVVTMALQPTIPVLAELVVRNGSELAQFFKRVLKTASILTTVSMVATAISSPLISWLFLGEINPSFVITTAVLCVTWATTTLASPSYYLGLAAGRVWPYVVGEFLAVAVSAALVFLLSHSWSPWLALLGVLAGKATGSTFPAYFNRPSRKRSSAAIFDARVLGSLALVSTVCLAIGLIAGQVS